MLVTICLFPCRASVLVLEADWVRTSTQTADIAAINKESRDMGFVDGAYCPDSEREMSCEHACRVAHNGVPLCLF
jgi:hypothetical protein